VVEEAERLGVPRSTIQRRRRKLKEQITVDSDKHKTIITVNNYAALTRVPSRSTDLGHFSQRNGDPEPGRDQPNTSAINQTPQTRTLVQEEQKQTAILVRLN
jgi:hypothetical protein